MQYSSDLASLLGKAPTPSHYVDYARNVLVQKGFTELKETDIWEKIPQKFFVVRDERQIVAVNLKDNSKAFVIAGSSDSDGFKTKPRTKLTKCGCELVRVAPYGNPTIQRWLDRDLKIAGRVIYKNGDSFSSKLFESEEPVAVIPMIAPHLNRDPSFNTEDNIVPIMSLASESSDGSVQSPALIAEISKAAKIDPQSIVDFDVTFVDSQPAKIIGINKDLLNGSRIDTVLHSLIALRVFTEMPDPVSGASILSIYDCGRIGHNSRVGACSNLLQQVLDTINIGYEARLNSIAIGNSNINETAAEIGSGPQIIFDPNYQVATEIPVEALISSIANSINIQTNITKSTSKMVSAASITSCVCGIPSADIGFPVLAPNSIRQTASVSDIQKYEDLLKALYAGLTK